MSAEACSDLKNDISSSFPIWLGIGQKVNGPAERVGNLPTQRTWDRQIER